MKKSVGELKFSDKLIALRSIDVHTVSRYRQAMRTGSKFPPMIVNAANNEVVCGNHRLTAYMEEYGDDYIVDVDARKFKNYVEIIKLFTTDNVKNGRPLDSFTRQKIAIALAEAGEDLEAVAALLNVPVSNLQDWGGRTVVVIGTDKQRHVEPIKRGLVVPKGTMTEAQYKQHTSTHIGMTVKSLADQLSERIENGWIDVNDEEEIKSLERLMGALESLKARK